MCTILGVQGSQLTQEDLLGRLAHTASRGPDSTRLIKTPNGYLGFQRLAIMGLTEEGMQPFRLGDDLVVCNGELYGFRPLRERLRAHYAFQSDSDCEILLPLYREYGLDLFKALDAEFALLLYDARRGGLVAARDPIGIRPLYYASLPDGGMMFASEPKNLTGLGVDILPFPPGCYWADGCFTRYADVAQVDQFTMGSVDEVCNGLRKRLTDGVRKRLDADAPVGFLLSGGLDSSLVCAIAARLQDQPIRTFAIGMEKDAIDLRYARMVADYIGSDHTEVYMRPEDIENELENVVALLATWDITTIRASMGMYLVCRHVHRHTDIRVLMTGEISDELFGYKYTDFAPDASSFQQEAEKRLAQLHMYDVLRADRCISVNSLEARVPFGDLAFVRYAMSIDPVLKMNRYGMGKYLLRHAFEGDDLLPPEILWRQKAAFSDAVGHSMVDDLKRLAEERYTNEDYARLRLQYTYGRPFTKESLMYRQIFETYYPGQAGMIADFWMPNKSWQGCDVDDPSARVLANYGTSGV